MIRILLAALAGAAIVYVWGMAAWMIVPLHDASVRKLADEQRVVEALTSQDLQAGLYVLPAMPEHDPNLDAPGHQELNEQWMTRHREGPVASIFYTPVGGQPMAPALLGAGFLIDFLAALIAAFVVYLSDRCRSYLARAGVVALMGLFAAIVSHVAYWNWMAFPLDHTIAMTVDVVFGWTLGGLVMAAILGRPASQSEPSSI